MASNGRLAYNIEAEEDDVDDFTFLKHPKQGSSGYVFGDQRSSNYGSSRPLRDDPWQDDHRGDGYSDRDRRQQLMMDEIERIQKRTLDSSARSLGLVHESEQIGVATAEELMAQREQLEGCETKVSDVNRSLRQSQKHINSIKSIFGGFMNRFSKNPPDGVPIAPAPKKPVSDDPTERKATPSSLLSSAVSETKSNSTYKTQQAHPALRLRGLDYDTPQTDESTNPFEENRVSSVQVEQQLNRNLDDLGLGLSRLKGLAIGLGDEIEDQNAMLDRLGNSVDRADLGIQRQRKQMDKILKK